MSLTFDELLDGTIEQAERAVPAGAAFDCGDPVWREYPAAIRDFVQGPEHLGLPPLFPRQYAAFENLLGTDPRRTFEEPQPPERKPLAWRRFRSSNVRRAAHAPEYGLVVEFADEQVYRYADAPPAELAALVKAPSKGKHLHARIKARFQAERVEQPADELRTLKAVALARAYQIAVLLWGKGSGKDYLCSIVIAYLLHVLLCLRDPQAYFEFGPGENIDVVNVAYSADQAKRVFFEKLKQRLYGWTWLRERFDVFEAGRRKWPDTKGRGDDAKVEINDGELLFPRGIRAFSRHSENEAYEGLNIIAWVMDEASAFLSKAKKENAGRIYQTLRTSAASRFLKRWVGFIISYPRHADDFTMGKLREARKHPEAGIYGDGPAATWDVNERIGRGEWVEVRPGHHVPAALANDYILDFDEARAKYECLPPAAKDALIRQPERVWQAVQRGRRALIEWEPVETVREVLDGEGNTVRRRFAAVRITRMGALPKGTSIYWHGDPARSSDAFSLVVGHGVPATIMQYVPAGEVLSPGTLLDRGLDAEQPIPWEVDVQRTVIDAVIVWRPDPRRDMQVDLLNTGEVISQVCDAYRVGAGSFDQYDSAETVQRLQARKLPVENEQWSNPFQHRIYRGARSAFYNDLVTLPDTDTVTSEDASAPGAIYELTRVEEIEGHKIDHPEDGSKDIADGIVRVIEHVTGASQARMSFGTIAHPGTPTGPPRLRSGQATVNPASSPSPVTGAHRAAEARRQVERPEGELVEGAGVQPGRRGGMSFGNAPRRG